MKNIFIDQKECIGCSFCCNCAPEIFEVDQDDFKCKIKKEGKLSTRQLKQTKEAIKGCPVQAIKLTNEEKIFSCIKIKK